MINSLKIFLFLLLSGTAIGQDRQILLICDTDATKIDFAHIFLDEKLYAYSDEKGQFSIKKDLRFQELKISHLLYETMYIDFNKLSKDTIIKLKSKSFTLDEVSINTKKKKRKTKTLLPEKSIRDIFTGNNDLRLIYQTGRRIDGEITDDIYISRAVYVPNKYPRKNTIVTKIILNSVVKPIEGDTVYIPFKVNLMTYDTINRLPKDKIFEEDLAVGKKRGETITIDLSKERFIDFPKEGLCVMVSVYDTEYYMLQGYNNPPAFDAVQIQKSSSFREYYLHGFMSDKWSESMYSVTREQCFNFGIEIEFLE